MSKNKVIKYIVINGMLLWGLPAGFLAFVFEGLITYGWDWGVVFSTTRMDDLLLNLIIFPIGGIIWGAWMYLSLGKNKQDKSRFN